MGKGMMKPVKKIENPNHFEVEIEFWAKEYDAISRNSAQGIIEKQDIQLIDKAFQEIQRPELKRDKDGHFVIQNDRAIALKMKPKDHRILRRIFNTLKDAVIHIDEKNRQIREENKKMMEEFRKIEEKLRKKKVSAEKIEKRRPEQKKYIPYGSVTVRMREDDARYLIKRMKDSLNDYHTFEPWIPDADDYFTDILNNIEKYRVKEDGKEE